MRPLHRLEVSSADQLESVYSPGIYPYNARLSGRKDLVWFTVSDFRETWQSHSVLCGENMRERLLHHSRPGQGLKITFKGPPPVTNFYHLGSTS